MDATKIAVYGTVEDPAVYAIEAVVQSLARRPMPIEVDKKTYLEPEYADFLREQQLALGGRIYGHKGSPLVFVGGAYLGGYQDFINLARNQWGFQETVAVEKYQAAAVEELRRRLLQSKNVFCFMDVNVPGQGVKRVIYELFEEICPNAVENFRVLCTGEKGRLLSYKGSPFHRVVKDGWIQGGDIVTGAGDGGLTIYNGLESFPDESFSVQLNKAGMLGLANKGPHSSASQFFITLGPTPFMQNKLEGIGRVVQGLDVFYAINNLQTLNERPVQECLVVNCGQVKAEGEMAAV